jgi:D-alanyl-D-alanine carboxypeptidase
VRRGLLLVLLALAATAPAGAQEAEGPTLGPIPNEPAGWVLVDADTGAVLAGREARTPRLPASTIKIFTALVAAQRLPADAAVPISAHAAGMPARIINAEAGQVWDREDLLASMLLVSANDAAVAVAEHVGGGSLDGWARVAGTVAEALGLEDSPALTDPAGLDDEFSNQGGSRISPRDLAIVARAVLAEPELMAIAGAQEIRFVGGDGIDHVVDRRNRLLDLYPGAVGLKTGLTERAGRCLVAAATRGGRTMVAVLLDAPDMYLTAATLLDHGFATPVAAEEGLDVLPDVVPDAALDPPERIPGALDVAVTRLGAGGDGGGLDWQSPPVALGVLVVGLVPLVAVRRRQHRALHPY